MGNKMSQQSNINNVNALIQNAQKAIACDQTCQREKQAKELKDKYQAAQTNLSLAEPQYEVAKQNYYTFEYGQSGYNEMIEKEMSQKADEEAEKFQERVQQDVRQVQKQIDSYDGIRINFDNVYDLYSQYVEDNRALEKTYKDMTNDVLTNERKTYYEQQQIEMLNKYYRVLLILYIITVIVFFVFSMSPSSNVSLLTRLGMGLFFIILPFVSSWILGAIVYLLYLVYSILPKNVYLTLWEKFE